MAVEEKDDGSDIFWPGYVDAVTNLVLNLLFMLTIMIVAVFMFALELSRHKDDVPTSIVATEPVEEEVTNQAVKAQETLQEKLDEIVKENDEEVTALKQQLEELKTAQIDQTSQQKLEEIIKERDIKVSELLKELESLKKQVASNSRSGNSPKVVVAKTPLPKPEKNLEAALQAADVVVDFKLESVTLSKSESEKLGEALSAFSKKGSARVEVFVPAGFSEAKRLGFYRAIAVRNQLLEMNIPKDKIEVLVHEGKANADNTKVLVSQQK